MKPGTALLAATVASLPGTLMGVALNAELAQGGLLNPDSAMRLVRLHDILAAGTPLHSVMRDSSGDGTLLHWSHLLDSLLLLLAAPAAAFAGWDAALHGAALLAGPLMLAALGVAMAWAAQPFAPRGWAWVAAAAAGGAPAVAGYGMTGVVHHHVLLAVSAVMAGGWALRLLHGASPVAGGLALGTWCAAGLWLSPETLPFALMAMGALWIGWLSQPTRAAETALAASGLAFAVLTAAAVLADPPAAGWTAVEPDRISLPYLLLALDTAAIGLLARRTRHRGLTLTAGLASAALWLSTFPQMLRGSEALIPAEVVAAMFDGIEEMLPVRGAGEAASLLLGGLFAVAVLLVRALRRPAPLRLYALACGVGLVALGAAHVRFAIYPTLAGAVLLPLAIGWASAARVPAPLQPLARVGMVLALLLGPVLLPAVAAASPGAPGTACRISGAAALLAPYPDQVVLSDVNDTPELLYRTRARTVGSLYHRAPRGFMRLRAAWRAEPGEVPGPAMASTRATLLLACPGAARSGLVADLPRTTLSDRVQAGAPPPWLHRLADAGPGGYVLYAVTP